MQRWLALHDKAAGYLVVLGGVVMGLVIAGGIFWFANGPVPSALQEIRGSLDSLETRLDAIKVTLTELKNADP